MYEIPMKCTFNQAWNIYLPRKRVIVVVSPLTYESGNRVIELRSKEGYNVKTLNSGNEEEWREALTWLSLCLLKESKIIPINEDDALIIVEELRAKEIASWNSINGCSYGKYYLSKINDKYILIYEHYNKCANTDNSYVGIFNTVEEVKKHIVDYTKGRISFDSIHI